MRRKPPTAVMVIAILHFVFGGLGLLCGVCGGVMELAGGAKAFPQAGDAEQRAHMQRQEERRILTEKVQNERIPFYQAYTATNRVMNLVLSAVMVVAGFGLVYLKSWGRWLSVGYAVVSLLLQLVVLFYTVVYFGPAKQEVYRIMPPADEQERMEYSLAMPITPVCSGLVLLYPLAVLVVMFLPSVAKAFQPRPPSRRRRREEDYDEGDDHDRPARRRRREEYEEDDYDEPEEDEGRYRGR
jgi:hypothetical protein